MLDFGEALAIDEALTAYDTAWQQLRLSCKVLPTTLSVKVADKTQLFSVLERNAADIDQVHIGSVNNRYIASATLRQPYRGLALLKILERRPQSSDPLGLDSIDYLVDNLDKTYQALQSAGLSCERESNDMHSWLSLRFGENQQFEAKFTDHLVLAIGIQELELANTQLLQALQE